ncbi:MAG: hypothetical protein IKA32_05955, partial [Lentisphaeria bacterium]|nr:hypothetical protein [Lentisphaeria bacterium]
MTKKSKSGTVWMQLQKNTLRFFPFIRLSFTLIELLVITAQHCRHFISNACTVLSQNTPLFLKEKGSARGKENFFSREKKLSFP